MGLFFTSLDTPEILEIKIIDYKMVSGPYGSSKMVFKKRKGNTNSTPLFEEMQRRISVPIKQETITSKECLTYKNMTILIKLIYICHNCSVNHSPLKS